jgi:Domain of unknown function (DUF4411)
MIYLLDANAFMEASRLYYGFDIVPGFWKWLQGSDLNGKVASVKSVKDEITSGTGDLVAWANSLPASFWMVDTAASTTESANLAAWANHPDRIYRSEAVAEFMGSADLRLIAQAAAINATVVTREVPAPQSQRKIKIPDACDQNGVDWTDPFSAYRDLGLILN